MEDLEDLIDRVSQKIGPKWTLLFQELKLESRVRFDIQVKFDKQKDQVKFISCSKESLKLWLNQSSIKSLKEEEKMKRLLTIIAKIEDLQQIAYEISFKQLTGQQPALKQRLAVDDSERGQTEAVSTSYLAHQPHPLIYHTSTSFDSPSFGPSVSTTPDPSTYSASSLSQKHAQHLNVREDLGWSKHAKTAPTCREGAYGSSVPISFGDYGSYPAHFMTDRGDGVSRGSLEAPEIYSAPSSVPGVYSTLPPVCRTYGLTTTMEEATSFRTVPSLDAPLIEEETDPCDAVIIIQDRYHKYALLDISQRMLRSNWMKFGLKLKLREEFLTQLERSEKNIQERYYKVLVEFVKEFREKATFKIIRNALQECDEKLAVGILEERLLTRTELVISAIEYDFLTNKNL